MNTIVLTTISLTLISAAFALLLTIADRTIGNYGEVKLIINDDKEYIVDGGSSLLSTLINEQIFIPSACGGKGTCGYCKVQVHEGGGPVLTTELPFLTKEEIENDVRLSCQCKVKEDIKIEIPDELFSIKEYKASVESIIDLTNVIKMLRIALSEDEEMSFIAGQYVQLKAPLYEGNTEEIYRAYSIASSPLEEGYIDLIIGYVPEGIATTYVHHHLNVEDEIHINGPYGDFYYQDNDREMIMAAVGTGVAPILSILNYMRAMNIQRKATFYFGAKTPEDLFLLDYFKDLEENLYDFKFVPCLSRIGDDSDWDGFRGRVNNAIDEFVTDIYNKEAYLCGNGAMIESVVDSLTKKGMPEELIYFDMF